MVDTLKIIFKKPVQINLNRLFLFLGMQKFSKILLLSIICLISGVQLVAQKFVTDQLVSANFYQKPLNEVLVSVSKSSGVNISFNPVLVQDQKKITINVKGVSLGDFLDVILEDTGIEYKINGKQIILVKAAPSIKEFVFPFTELKGYIEDGETGERLPFAYLYTKDGEIAVTTNEYGYYNFQVPENTEGIYISYLGYKDTLINIDQLGEEGLAISLANSTTLNEVVIEDKPSRDLVDDHDIYVNTNIKQMKRVQTFGGQMDVLRFIHTLPGVSTGADGLGGFAVRGGNADHNLILLDGIPIYNSSHGLGVFSIFDQSSIKSSKFYRSHIPAKYGGRLSSVLDIRTKEGSLQKHSGEINIGLLTAAAYVEGPIIKDKVSFAISGRRTLFEPYLEPISEVLKRSQDREGFNDYKFYDINAKLQFVLNKKNRLYLSYYGGNDAFVDSSTSEFTDEEYQTINSTFYDWSWGNQLMSLRLSSLLSDQVFSNVSLYSSSYNFDAYNYSLNAIDTIGGFSNYVNDGSLYKTSIRDLGIKWDVDYYINSKNKAKIGLSAINHNFSPGLVAERNQDTSLDQDDLLLLLENQLVIPPRIANEIEVYYDHRYNYKGTILNAGVRGSLISSDGRSYYNLQPRLSIKRRLLNSIYGKLSGNMTSQYLHLLASSGLGLPTDIWIPSTSKIKPQNAYQISGGFDFLLSKKFVLSTEVYYKGLSNVLNLKEGAVFSVIEDTNWEDDIPVGKGIAYGFELALNGNIKQHYLNLNYHYGFSLRQFEKINSGEWFPSRFDRRHQMNFNYQYTINSNFSFNTNFVLATGHPQTLPTLIQNNEILYTEKNNQRLPTYERLDASFQIDSDFGWAEQTITLGVYNLYNKKNPYFYFLEFPTDNLLDFEAKQVTVFPLLPNVSYTLRF